jgi:hypothetical protein
MTPSLRRIERINYVLAAALVVLGVLTQPRAIALGLAVGAALTCVNFYVLRKLVTKWTSDTAAGRTSSSMMLVIPKMTALMAAVVACLAFLPIDAIAFVIGYSLFLASIVVEVFVSAMRTGRAVSENDHG